MNSTEKQTEKFLQMSKTHYENFPVGSFLFPKEIRKDISLIYWFARTADDFADEGNFTDDERLQNLIYFESRLDSLLNGNFNNKIEEEFFLVIQKRKLNSKHFYDLLSAFKQDVVKKRYETFEELINYCSRSANPVGRLILELHGFNSDEMFNQSDKICTALQLTNFWQDTSIDWQKGRIYYPKEDLNRFEISENTFAKKENSINFKQLVRFQIERTNELFISGEKLVNSLNGKLKVEIIWTISGGKKILDKIVKTDYSVLTKRVRLNKIDFGYLLLKSFFNARRSKKNS